MVLKWYISDPMNWLNGLDVMISVPKPQVRAQTGFPGTSESANAGQGTVTGIKTPNINTEISTLLNLSI